MSAIIYLIVAYWATGQTVFKDKILIGTGQSIFLQRVAVGALFGIFLIPWAIIASIIRAFH